MEESGTEQPDNPDDPVSIEAARLPAGGGDEENRCVDISYLGDTTIPPGVRLAVTGATVDPAIYRVGGAGCDDEPTQRCLGTGFAFTADNEDEAECVIPVQAVGFAEDDRIIYTGRRTELQVIGTILCPLGQGGVCAGVAEELRGEDTTIRLGVPRPPTTTTTVPATTARPAATTTTRPATTTTATRSQNGAP